MAKLRKRYLVVRTNPNSLEPVLKKLEKEFPRLKLIEVKDARDFSLVRCAHIQLLQLRERLNALGIETAGASGTIRRAISKFVRKS